MNKVILIGRLTKDPEVKYTQTGKVVATFTLAVDRNYGENKQTDFIPIVVWGKIAEIVGNNLSKGRKISVDGRIQTRSYEDKQGQKRWVTEVIGQLVEFLDSKESNNANTDKPTESSASSGKYGPEIYPDDDVPF